MAEGERMNNSFGRLIDGMCATLRQEVLTRLDDDFARGQVFGVINLLNTFKVRADWSAGFLLQQIAAQSAALEEARSLMPDVAAPPPVPFATPIAELLEARDAGNRAIADALRRLDSVPADVAARVEGLLLAAMRAEIEIELKNSPRPLFAEMSSGREG
jgi:hypothetical protein